MPKPKKDARPFSLRMASEIYDRMEKYCAETGVPKTAIIERALIMYLDDYEKTQERMKLLMLGKE